MTVFHQLLQHAAAEAHAVPQIKELVDEAYVIVSAASETTGNALTIAAYHILSNDDIRDKLTTELKEAFPGPSLTLDFVTLEKLPYLVIKPRHYVSLICLTNLADWSNQRGPQVITTPCGLPASKRKCLTSIRLSYGVLSRLPRVTPPPGAVFNGYKLPPGVCTCELKR
jgi:hypothetical protein